MEQPTMRVNPETGEVEEYRPVKVTKESLAADVQAAEEKATKLDKQVDAEDKKSEKLIAEQKKLEAQLEAIDRERERLLPLQEAAHEEVAFRQGKLSQYDALLSNDQPVPDADPSPVSEVVGEPNGSDPAGSDAEPEPASDAPEPGDSNEINDEAIAASGANAADVPAEFAEPAEDQAPATDEEVAIPIRRRSPV